VTLWRFRLDDEAAFAVSRAARDSVDGIPLVDLFADDSISALAQPSERRSDRVRQPSRCFGQVWDGRAIGSPHQANHPRQLAAGSGRERLGVFINDVRPRGVGRSGLGCGCVALLGAIAASNPSSTAMAFNPAAVSLSA
jgi:hypothetical protein